MYFSNRSSTKGLGEGIVRTASNRGGIQSSVRDLKHSDPSREIEMKKLAHNGGTRYVVC